jgi:3-methylcrotonyl-CoA carboxylase alpha subunit
MDRAALHVRMADEAYPSGLPSAESYLNMDKSLRRLCRHAEAIHPGYGFLSENSEFARRCAAAGGFVGRRRCDGTGRGKSPPEKQLEAGAVVPGSGSVRISMSAESR